MFKSYSLSNFQVYFTVLLTVITVLYIRSKELIHLVTGGYTLWLTSPHLRHPLALVISTLFSVSVSLAFLDSTSKWYTIFVFLWFDLFHLKELGYFNVLLQNLYWIHCTWLAIKGEMCESFWWEKHITLTHILIAGIQSRGYTSLQGRLANVGQLCSWKERELVLVKNLHLLFYLL